MGTITPDQLDRTFDRMERITAVGTVLSALEALSRPDMLRKDGLFCWDVQRTRSARFDKEPLKTLLSVFDYPAVTGIHAARLASAVRLLFGDADRKSRTGHTAALAGSTYALGVRTHYGADGSDHMAILSYAATTLEKVFPDDPRVRKACLWFVAAEVCLSYTTAGLAKAASPLWRNGHAMPGIFRTRTYGHRWLGKVCKEHPNFARAMCWSVILAETLWPLVLFAPAEVAWPLLLLGLAFHLGNAHFMGLNRFLWAFAGSYPAVIAVSRHLDEKDPARFVRFLLDAAGPAAVKVRPAARTATRAATTAALQALVRAAVNAASQQAAARSADVRTADLGTGPALVPAVAR